jgi:hypothetical protein
MRRREYAGSMNAGHPVVRLVTAAHLPDLLPDDQELLHALRRRGVETAVDVWDDPDVDWAAAPLTVVRSVHDYHLRRDDFIAWIDRIEPLTRVVNPPEIIRWNSHKSYLRRLADSGIATVPTAWARQGEPVDLGELMAARSWPEAIVKPAVSASAHATLKVGAANLAAGNAHLAELLRSVDALVQPYLYEFETKGETSVIWLGGEQTHSVRRPPGIHIPHGAMMGVPLEPPQAELDFARTVYEWIAPEPLYARVDVLDSPAYGLCLLELELVEPALYLGHDTAFADTFAAAVCRLLE